MKRHLLARGLLGTAGGLLLVIGVSIMADPRGFAASNGIGADIGPSLASELRAPSGFLIASGLFMLFGTVRGRWLGRSLVLAGAVYTSYGLARFVGLLVDGMPSATLVQAMGLEVSIGSLCLFAAFNASARGQPARHATKPFSQSQGDTL